MIGQLPLMRDVGFAERSSAVASWFAIHSQAQKEESAARDLRRRGFEVFWPYVSEWVGTGHKAKSRLVKRSWLSRYLFVRTNREGLTEVQDERAKNMGVAAVVRATNNEPFPVSDIAMQQLFNMTDHLGEVYQGSTPKGGPQFNVGQIIRFIDERNPLFGFLAEVKKVLDNRIIATMFTQSLLGSQDIILTSSGGIEVVALKAH